MFGSRVREERFRSISKRFTISEMDIQVLHFLFCNQLGILLLGPENGVRMNLQSSTHCINGCFDFSRKLLKLAAHKYTQTYYRKLSTSSPEMTSSTTSGPQQIAFTPPLPSPTSPYKMMFFYIKIFGTIMASNFKI